MVDGFAQGALARGRTADNSTAVFRLDARHENALTRGSHGVTTPAAGKPVPPARPRQSGEPAARGWRGWWQIVLLPFALVLGLSFAGPGFAAQAARHVREAAAAVQSMPAARLDREAVRTLRRIRAGGPFPYAKDGIVFGNYERLLPAAPRGYYREYTVLTPGSRNRGARRIICGGAPRSPDVCYYTHDHYASFQYIAR